MLDMEIIKPAFHRIVEINTADIKCLERVDGMHIGIDRPGLHFQVRTTRQCHVTHAADSNASTPVTAVERRRELIMARVTFSDIDDIVSEEAVIKITGGQNKGPGNRIEGYQPPTSIIQFRHDPDFHSLDDVIIDHASPG
jgi:hypothetical protein